MEEDGQITVNEPVAAYGTNSYMDVMNMLHSMPITRQVKEQVAHRLVQEVTEPALSAAFDKIEEMGSLQDGWAGDGSYAVSRRVLNNLKSVLLISDNKDWENWMMGPDVNATIGLQSRSHRALISLGAKEFSYYVLMQGKKISGSHVPFNPEIFLKTMREIA
jgi:hypothetical protein